MKITHLLHKLSIAVVAATAITGLSASMASASIIGDTVSVRFTDFVAFDETRTVVVQNGVDGSFFGNYLFDIEDNFVRFIVNGNFCGHTCAGRDAAIIFSGLNFGSPILGVSITDGGLGPYGGTFSSDSVTMMIPDRQLNAGSFAQADITLTSVTSVPEPTSIALFGLGLLGFAASRRNAAR